MSVAVPGCEIQAYARIVSPAAGEFVSGDTVEVRGFLENMPLVSSTQVVVNGVTAVIDPADSTWSATVPLNHDAVFNRIVAEARLLGATLTRQQIVVVAVDGVNSGVTGEAEQVQDALSLRVNNAGLDQIEPIVQDLAGDSLDIGAIITDQNPLLDNDCVLDPLGLCIARATVSAVDVGFGGFGLEANSVGPGRLSTTLGIQDLFVEVELDVTGPASIATITCGAEFTASSATIQADFDLGPAADAHKVDVNLSGNIDFALAQLETNFISGLCDDPLIGDVVDIIADSLINDLLSDAFDSILRDPDGAGAQDSPIADAIEEVLFGITIAQDVGVAFGVSIDAPISSIAEDGTGFGLLVDAAVTQSQPLPNAPDLPEAYAVLDETPPSFGDTTPSGQPYGLALGISASAMNQMLAALIEGGLLQLNIAEAALPPVILQPAPLTVGLISLLIGPEFLAASANRQDPVVVQVRPTLAPVLTGKEGPNGEMFEIKLGGLEVSFTLPNDPDFVPLSINLSLTVGVDLAFNETGLAFDIGTIATDGIDVYVTQNPIGADEANIVSKFKNPELLSLFTGPLSEAIQFPIPTLLGLDLAPVELARVGTWISLYTDLTQIPKPTIANVRIIDNSTADQRKDSAFDVEEWRHRVSGTSNSSRINAKLQGFIGADACCTVSDRNASATAAYQVRFDVVSPTNEPWELNLSHSIAGAFDLKDDSVLLSDGGGLAEFANGGMISAEYQSTASGESGAFGFKPNVTKVVHAIGNSKSDTYRPFSGSNQTTLTGVGNTSMTVTVTFSPHAFSDSNVLLPAVSGDKAGIRFGKQDTIDNHFNIGDYPGIGNRNIANDGHKLNISLSSAP